MGQQESEELIQKASEVIALASEMVETLAAAKNRIAYFDSEDETIAQIESVLSKARGV